MESRPDATNCNSMVPAKTPSRPARGGQVIPRAVPVAPRLRDASSPSAQTQWAMLLHAVRMRWPFVVLLGIPLAAALGYLAWSTTPTPYTAHAELFCQPRKFFWETKDTGSGFDVYKQTTMRLITDPMVLTAALRNPEVSKTSFVQAAADPIEKIARSVSVRSPAQEFIRLELQGQDPNELAKIINGVVDAFMEEVVVKDQQSRKDRLGGLQAVLAKEQEALELKQAQLRAINKQLEAPNETQGDVKRQARADMQLEIRRQMAQLQPQIIELELAVEAAKEAAATETGSSTTATIRGPDEDEWQSLLMQDEQYARLAAQHAGAVRSLKAWTSRVADSHPKIAQLRAESTEAEAALKDRRKELEPIIQAELREAFGSGLSREQAGAPLAQQVDRLARMKELLERYSTELQSLQVAEKKYADDWVDRDELAEEIEVLKATVDAYAGEVRNRQVELENAPPAIRIHQRARVPSTPDTKKRLLATIAAVGAGLGLVTLLVLLLEFSALRISDMSLIRTKTSAPVLGVVPLIPTSLSGRRFGRPRASASFWRDVLREAFDGVQSMLRHSHSCSNARVIMVTSSAEGEGKTTCASQLALGFARAGYRVLLIDGDLKRPSLEREFSLEVKAGLCEVLEEKLPLDEAIIHTDLAELDLLPAGQLTDKTRGRLSRDEHAALFSQLSEHYDFVFVDTAPVLVSVDTLFLAKHVDGVLMLVRKDFTRLRRFESSLRRFELLGIPVLGLITIGLEDTAGGYGYGNYGYGYSSYTYAREPVPAEEPAAALIGEDATSDNRPAGVS